METSIEELEQHLLYHKALAESPEQVERINGYIQALHDAADGTKLTDPVDEAARRVFTTVIENGMDPWAIDIGVFVNVYSEKVAKGTFDMVVAGKLIYMAWRVLSMQATEFRDRVEPPVEIDEDPGDFEFEEEDTNTVPVMDVVFSRAYGRTNTRKVTFVELMEAFDEAVEEEEVREARAETARKLRAQREDAPVQKFDNKAHEEDDETVVKRVFKTILERAVDGHISMEALYTSDIREVISCFVSVLHLVRYGLLDVEQVRLDGGDIEITVLDPKGEVPIAVPEV